MDSICHIRGNEIVLLLRPSASLPWPSSEGFRIHLACQLVPSEPLADGSAHGQIKPLSVVHLAVVETEYLLVKVPKQVERFNRNVSAFQPALQEPRAYRLAGCEPKPHGHLHHVPEHGLRLRQLTTDNPKRHNRRPPEGPHPPSR